MNRFLYTLAALGISFAAVTTGLSAQPMMDHDGPMFMGDGDGPDGKHFQRMADELGLTKEQRESAKKMHEARHPKMKQMMEQMRPLHEDLRKLLEADKVQMSAVRAKLEAISKIQVEMRLYHIEGRLAFEATLTPQQKAKLREMHEKRMKEHGDHRGPHHDKDKGRK